MLNGPRHAHIAATRNTVGTDALHNNTAEYSLNCTAQHGVTTQRRPSSTTQHSVAQPRLVRRCRIHLLLALCFLRVFLPLLLRPQGEQLGLPPAVPPPMGWSTEFMATPRTCSHNVQPMYSPG